MRWVLSNFFIEAALGDDDVLAAGLGQGELECARDHARPQVQPSNSELPLRRRAGTEQVLIAGASITVIGKIGDVRAWFRQVSWRFERVCAGLRNLDAAKSNVLFFSSFINVSVRRNNKVAPVKPGVVGDEKVGRSAETAGGKRLVVEQAAEGVGAGLRGRGQLVGGRNRGGVGLALAALREQQQGQIQREVGFHLDSSGGDDLNVGDLFLTWSTL